MACGTRLEFLDDFAYVKRCLVVRLSSSAPFAGLACFDFGIDLIFPRSETKSRKVFFRQFNFPPGPDSNRPPGRRRLPTVTEPLRGKGGRFGGLTPGRGGRHHSMQEGRRPGCRTRTAYSPAPGRQPFPPQLVTPPRRLSPSPSHDSRRPGGPWRRGDSARQLQCESTDSDRVGLGRECQ